jgi:flavin-dependent dehydrogenase
MSETKIDSSYDVLIVGSGPAGASAARELVRSGRRVLIIEKKKLPRYKICSGLIQDDAQDMMLEKFGNPPPSVFCRPPLLNGVRFCAAGDSMADLPLEKPQVMNVWRSEFDHWLVRESGAEVLERHHLIGLTQTADRVQATVTGPNKEKVTIEASYLIGADGGRSSIRKLLSPAFEKTVSYSNFTQVYCRAKIDLDPLYFYMFFDPSLSAFYTWLHIKDDTLVYGVGAYKDKSVLQCLQDSTGYLAGRFGLKIERVERRTGCVVSDMAVLGKFFLGDGRVLLAGEAAGFMHVFGEGISAALLTGSLAGTAVCRVEDSVEKLLPLYADLVRHEQNRTVKSWKAAATLMKKNSKPANGI